jgi:hypothetical protein
LHRWAGNQEGFGSDSDSPGALSEGESTLGGGAAGDSFSLVAEEPNMEPDLSPRETIAMERRLWKVILIQFVIFHYSHQSPKVRHSLNSLPAPSHVMSRLFGNDDQWRYAQQVRHIDTFLYAGAVASCSHKNSIRRTLRQTPHQLGNLKISGA